jgi:vanillate O-demethylase ferredoxin subunit
MSTPETLDLIVRRREVQGQGIVLLDLADAAGAVLPAFEAGAHIDVHLPGGLVRQYSLCGDPADLRRYRLGVLQDPASRGGSIAVHAHLVEGAVVTVGRPRNHFPLAADAQHSVLLGGGIGITPLIAMAHALHAANRSFELHYSARAARAAAFLDELAAAPFAGQVRRHFDDEGGASLLDVSSVLTTAPAGTHVYVCGPSGFIDWVIAAAAAQGLADARIHREYFSVDVDTRGGAFEVVAAASGKSVHVGADQTILAALAAIGIKVDVSCEEGVCGTCVCTVLEGKCDHRDVYLTEQEKADNDQIMVCCSRSLSARLVLDI